VVAPVRSISARRAFILVDVLVATVLMGLSLAVISSMISTALSAQRTGERLEVAAMLLDEQLNMVLARGPENYAQRFGLEGRCDAPFQDYAYQLEFEGGNGEAFTVTATIAWTQSGRVLRESVQTRIAPRLGEETDPQREPQETVVRPR
jgi:type II secretory pathway pseudopilin PulG